MSESNGTPPLERDVEKGWILEGKIRIMSLRAKTFQSFVDKLVVVAGPAVSAVLLGQMGAEIGRSEFAYSKDEIHTEEDLVRLGDRFLRLRGWGRIIKAETRKEDGKSIYTYSIADSILSHERQAKVPTCHLIRGLVVGWLEAYLGKKSVGSVERECASLGSQNCVFDITFAH